MKLLTRLKRKTRCLVRDERGDTIAESLVAILIAALGAVVLATMVTVSVNVSTSMEQERSRIYVNESSMAASYDLSSAVAVISVTNTAPATSSSFKVTVYQSSDRMFTSYSDETATG